MTVRGRDKILRDKARAARDKARAERDQGTKANNRDKAKSMGYAARQNLVALAADGRAPASARVTAVRTLAEMDGLIGKHQAPPVRTSTVNLASLSRDDLVSELGRLRALVGLGLDP